jgi:hypothetical protein
MEQIFRSLQFALNQAVLNPDNNMLELPEFGNYLILTFGIVNPLLEDAMGNVRYWGEHDGAQPYEKLRVAFLDETDPQWRTKPRRF